MRLIITSNQISWTCCRRTLLEVVEHYVVEKSDLGDTFNPEVASLLRRLCDPASWPFLSSRPQPTGGGEALPSLDDTIEIVRAAEVLPRRGEIPRPRSRERIFLSLGPASPRRLAVRVGAGLQS